MTPCGVTSLRRHFSPGHYLNSVMNSHQWGLVAWVNRCRELDHVCTYIYQFFIKFKSRNVQIVENIIRWSRHDTNIHYDDVVMGSMASQITSLTIVYSIVYSDADQRKHQSSRSLAFVRGIHRGPANSSHKWPVTRKMFPFHDVIMHMLNMGLFLLTLLIHSHFYPHFHCSMTKLEIRQRTLAHI